MAAVAVGWGLDPGPLMAVLWLAAPPRPNCCPCSQEPLQGANQTDSSACGRGPLPTAPEPKDTGVSSLRPRGRVHMHRDNPASYVPASFI